MSTKVHCRYSYLYFYRTTKTSTGSLDWVAPLTRDVSTYQPGIRSQIPTCDICCSYYWCIHVSWWKNPWHVIHRNLWWFSAFFSHLDSIYSIFISIISYWYLSSWRRPYELSNMFIYINTCTTNICIYICTFDIGLIVKIGKLIPFLCPFIMTIICRKVFAIQFPRCHRNNPEWFEPNWTPLNHTRSWANGTNNVTM